MAVSSAQSLTGSPSGSPRCRSSGGGGGCKDANDRCAVGRQLDHLASGGATRAAQHETGDRHPMIRLGQPEVVLGRSPSSSMSPTTTSRRSKPSPFTCPPVWEGLCPLPLAVARWTPPCRAGFGPAAVPRGRGRVRRRREPWWSGPPRLPPPRSKRHLRPLAPALLVPAVAGADEDPAVRVEPAGGGQHGSAVGGVRESHHPVARPGDPRVLQDLILTRVAA